MKGKSEKAKNWFLFYRKKKNKKERKEERRRKQTSPLTSAPSPYFNSNSVCPLTISDRPGLNLNSQFLRLGFLSLEVRSHRFMFSYPWLIRFSEILSLIRFVYGTAATAQGATRGGGWWWGFGEVVCHGGSHRWHGWGKRRLLRHCFEAKAWSSGQGKPCSENHGTADEAKKGWGGCLLHMLRRWKPRSLRSPVSRHRFFLFVIDFWILR